MTAKPAAKRLEDHDYEQLLAFRNELRSFLRWSEERAHEAGLTPAMHQLLLVLRGSGATAPPTVAEVAAALHIRHHSAVELAQRAAALGLIDRERDANDHRCVHLSLTPHGRRQLERLTREHLPRVRALARTLQRTLPRDL